MIDVVDIAAHFAFSQTKNEQTWAIFMITSLPKAVSERRECMRMSVTWGEQEGGRQMYVSQTRRI